MGFCILPANEIYALLYPFDPKIVVGNTLVLLFISEKIKILFRKLAVCGLLVGWGFFWHRTLCAVFCFFIRKFMGKGCFIVR